MDSIKLRFRTTECNGWPKVQVLIDNDLYDDHLFSASEETITIPVGLLDGLHNLTIEIYGKTPKNTIVDEQGNIVKAQLIELTDIYINDVKLPEYFKYFGIYKFNGQEYPQATVWGCNGVWEWDFGTPLVTWALDKKVEQNEKYNPVGTPQIRLVEEKLKRFEIVRQLLEDLSEK